jgi:hypothetical protein
MSYGLAMTNRFMLGAATLLIGAQADLFNLTRAAHSVGLIKNFAITAEPSFTDLTQGVKNTLVYSVMTGNVARASAELYEFTPKNLAYVAQMNGATFTEATNTETTTSAAIAGSSGSPVTTVPVTSALSLAVDDWILIQNPAAPDDAIVRKITAISTNDLTVAPGITRAMATGATVRRMNMINVGSKEETPFFSAMVHGQLADGSEIAVALPKVRITNGLNLSFQTNDYGNMPIELGIYDLTPTDPNYAQFGDIPAKIFA